MTRMPDSGQTTRTMTWAVVAMVAITLAAVVALEALDASENVGQVLGVLAPVLAVLVTLRQVNNVQTKVDQVAQDTHDLTNGLLSASVRSGVAEVLHPDLIDPTAVPQVAEDAAVVQDHHADREEE